MSNEILEQIQILYEDEDCVVLNKPAGLMVHSDARNEGPFLTDWLIARYPALKGVGETQRTPEGVVLDRPGIVHRLDRETSGAILIAKTPEAHAFFKEQFQNKTVTKKYLAFVWGEMKEPFGTITRPIGRSFKGGPKRSAQRGARGEMREAETYWTKVWTGVSFVSSEKGQAEEKFSLIQAEPKTGRTHQIRVHLLAIHHPVVSDTLYAPKKPLALGFERQALHSWSFEFTTKEGKRMKVIAPFPEDFQHVLTEQKIDIKKLK